MKVFRTLRGLLFVTLGILTMVFAHQIMNNEGESLNIVVGASILLFAFDSILMTALEKDRKKLIGEIVTSTSMIIIALVILLAYNGNPNELIIICVLWGVWSILSEAKEIGECLIEFKENKIYSTANIIESVVLIIFSIFLILEPGEHHALTHVYLLGVEMILEAIWPILHEILHHLANKKKEQ